ncbi:phosphate ABC transporter permease PstA, partial [Kitasatospora albolonga]|uniref:phosphate ABC transporter permease PstA n=1 Tax=Kitasatospora albolonga TaxID=68173 RepID=UPI0031EDBF79
MTTTVPHAESEVPLPEVPASELPLDKGPRTTVVGRPDASAPPQRPRRIAPRRASDHYAFWGSLAASVAMTALLFQRFAPFSGGFGFVICVWLGFLGLYALLVSRDENGLAVRDRLASVVVHSIAALLLGVLVWVVGYVFLKGWDALSHTNFYTQDLSQAGPTDPLDKGGALHAIVGTLIQITISLAITIPVGISCAVFMSEVPGRFSRLVRTLVEAMTALPSILAGLFIYAVLVLALGFPRSGLAAGVALSVMMLPILIRATDVVLRLVPASLKEASYALGAGRWRTVWTVTLPSARSGLATAVILGAARGIGETSPVLLCSGYTKNLNPDPTSDPQASLPLMAFTLIKFPSQLHITRAFGAAAVLLGLVLLLFVVARTLGGRGPGDLTSRQRERRARQSAADLARMTGPATFPAVRKAPVLTRTLTLLTALAVVAGSLLLGAAPRAEAADYRRISGAGSTWSSNAVDAWVTNVRQYGMTIDFDAQGSSYGRNQFKNQATDFAVTEIPYGLTDGGQFDAPPPFPMAYLPIVAGGTSFMYNLKINGKRVDNLRLSGDTLTKLFTGVITKWNDPLVAADNPGLALPNVAVRPVVRSDGSGTTAQLTTWMSKRHQGTWDAYCAKTSRHAPCGVTSFYPLLPGSTCSRSAPRSRWPTRWPPTPTTARSPTSSTPTRSTPASPVVKVLNDAGYYVEPTARNVSVALGHAGINQDLTQRLDDVYSSPEKNAYPLSSYSYMAVHTSATQSFPDEKGKTLSAFGYYFLCEGQRQADKLGYSPLTQQLVKSGFEQLAKVPGSEGRAFDANACTNPTFGPNGTNPFAAGAPMPQECDKKGAQMCGTATGGAVASGRLQLLWRKRWFGQHGGRWHGRLRRCPGDGRRCCGQHRGAGGTGGAAAGGSSVRRGRWSRGGCLRWRQRRWRRAAVRVIPRSAAGTRRSGAGVVAARAGGGDGGQQVSATQVEIAASASSGLRHSLMLVAGLLLGAVIVLPPLVAGRAARSPGGRADEAPSDARAPAAGRPRRGGAAGPGRGRERGRWHGPGRASAPAGGPHGRGVRPGAGRRRWCRAVGRARLGAGAGGGRGFATPES